MSNHVLVLAPNWLGDAVMSLPALAALRRHVGQGRITVAARAGIDDLFRLSPDADDVVRLTWRGGLLQASSFREDARRLRTTDARVAVLFPNSLASAWLARGAGISDRWGYRTDARRALLTHAVPRPRGSRHQSQYYLELLRACGVNTDDLRWRLRVPDDTVAFMRTMLTTSGWDGVAPLLVLAPGAAYGSAKQWLLPNVAAVARAWTERSAAVVLVGGRADATATRTVRELVPAPLRTRVIDLAGQTTLEQLAAVCVLASACVSNDSGAMHLAAALGTPVVAPFGPTIDAETSPLAAEGGWTRVLTSPVWCRPCMLRECPLDHQCMSAITPQMVLGALDEVRSRPMPTSPQGSAR